MIHYENASRGNEGFNTHVLSYTLAVSLSNFLERDLYFSFEIPSSTPPDYLSNEGFRDRFSILIESERSLVSDLLELSVRKVEEFDLSSPRKLELQLVYSYFVTTDVMKQRFGGTMIWDSFGVGRIGLTREYMQQFDLIEWTHTKLSHANVFYFLPKAEKNDLLDTIKLYYSEPIERLASKINAQLGSFDAVHLRFGDFEQIYRSDDFKIDADVFARFARFAFPERDIPILIATDGLQEREFFQRIFDGHRLTFIDELIFTDFFEDFRCLPFTDFNVLTVLNQLICAAANRFVGTYRSTFTGIIHRLRQERNVSRDIDFFPDDKVMRVMSDEFRITPDRHGFFDWNRYSVFAEEHSDLAWKREWDRQLSALD
ncbi:MAG TPA: O-fucosyltransferase family protein [Pyrinomonadaceae bacterium]|nr:O-fucosyltransferase family protein [Pyrinomonadaceae bacterium]